MDREVIVPDNAVFRVGVFIFTDEGKQDGVQMVGIQDINGNILGCLPLDEAKQVYAAEFEAIRRKREEEK